MLVYGPADVACNLSGAGPYPLTISEPGLYRIAVTSTLTDGRTLSDETAVLVYDAGQLDALLQAKWSDMKARLAVGDIDGAIDYYGGTTQDDYREIFTALGTRLPQLVQQMQDIELIQAGEGFAKYRIKRDEVHQGQSYSITYDIYFSSDANGIWKIDRF